MALKAIFPKCFKPQPSIEACVYSGEYRVEARPLLRRAAEMDLSAIYGEWFDLTQIPPNTSIVITDGREGYAAYIRNSPATVVVHVPNAAEYAVWLARALEEAGLAYLIDYTLVAELEERIRASVKKYDVEAMRKRMEALVKRAVVERPPGKDALLSNATSEVEAISSIATGGESRMPSDSADTLAVMDRAGAISLADLCIELEKHLRALGLDLSMLLRLLQDEEFKSILIKYAVPA